MSKPYNNYVGQNKQIEFGNSWGDSYVTVGTYICVDIDGNPFVEDKDHQIPKHGEQEQHLQWERKKQMRHGN